MGNTIIQLRNETAANWTSANPTLTQGEMGIETDTNRIKFGDGITAWNSLPYFNSSFKYGLYTLSAQQLSNLTVNNHVEFNTSQGSLGGLSSGTGQQKGIITLAGGKTYKITSSTYILFSATTGFTYLKLYNRTSGGYFGLESYNLNVNYNTTQGFQPTLIGFIQAETDTDVELRFSTTGNNAVSGVSNLSTWLLIEEYCGY